jgi:type I restriction enzyme R subunit
VEEGILKNHLLKQGYSETITDRAISKFMRSVSNRSQGLYTANKEVYSMLRYGVSVRDDSNDAKQTVKLVRWDNPMDNDFAVVEEVTVQGAQMKRPDVVLYLNGIAVGVLELKNSRKGLEYGIRQNLGNQSDHFIPGFFTTMQLVLAGNDSQGLRYGTIGTIEKYYLKWKEEATKQFPYPLDLHLTQLCSKERLLDIIHDFVVFDKGTKKLCRPHQYFGIHAAQQRVLDREGGIIWHTQGSGKSLTMVWLTKWIRENIQDARVLIITDREELDSQIEGLFTGVDENIYRTKSGKDLISVLNKKEEWLICSLVHKFGRTTENGDYDSFIEELQSSIGSDFKAKGEIFVFVDECHRTQSGKLHKAMKTIVPEAMFIGFTGTPLLKSDKQKSIEVFGSYIGTPYKFDEAVEDGVVLDLLYEARDVDQFITDQQSIDEWFDAETRGLNDVARTELKKKWGTMQKVLGSKTRLEKIVRDIIIDFKVKGRLADGSGNAILVSNSVYNACRYYELFQTAGFKECAIVTSFQALHTNIKGEITGDGNPTEELFKYETYKKMLNGKSTEDFEAEIKEQFIKEPARMKLLIVVDKLLTGFDAPPATYLYIDKKMQDHGLFQAICRVNRVHDQSKEYGYIVDYKDLFMSLERSIKDYTSEAFDNYDASDVQDLLKDRLNVSKERLETALETVKAICEPVHPQDEPHFIRYFCGDALKEGDLDSNEELRVTLYKAVSQLVRSYANVANEMNALGYSEFEASNIKKEVQYYQNIRDLVKQASGDAVDLKSYEPGMRQLMDLYLDASNSRIISDFENQTLVELIVNVQEPGSPYGKKSREAMAETIENNVRKRINDDRPTNPKYFERMSHLLDELIKQRRDEVIAYEEYLEKIRELAEHIEKPSAGTEYPDSIDTPAKQALYDNLDEDKMLALALDSVINSNRMDGWKEGGIKERKLRMKVLGLLEDEEKTDHLMTIIKAQREY